MKEYAKLGWCSVACLLAGALLLGIGMFAIRVGSPWWGGGALATAVAALIAMIELDARACALSREDERAELRRRVGERGPR